MGLNGGGGVSVCWVGKMFETKGYMGNSTIFHNLKIVSSTLFVFIEI